ncbi:MAG TPA: hypothetical protein PLU64_02475 [Saprospiraceae bacterium]|nr:hypothetical protein [Lewinellaceae bacterium]HQU58022.1 hypothetical protein [Saprospiraceae bacterium]
MKELELKLSVDEVNQILEGLGNLPFKQVFALINKIQNQAEAQLQEAPPPADDSK